MVIYTINSSFTNCSYTYYYNSADIFIFNGYISDYNL